MRIKVWIFIFAIVLPTSVFAMVDNVLPVYGLPTLYGEYEISADDVRRASKLYGDMPRVRPMRVPDAVKAAAAKHPVKPKAVAKKSGKKQKKVSKKPVKAGKVYDEKELKVAAVSLTDVENAQKEVVIVDINTDVAVKTVDEIPDSGVAVASKQESIIETVPQTHIPVEYAAGIADSLSYKYDLDSYCTWRGGEMRSDLPDGIILMPGRPDLMSCTSRADKK